jgi:hypothetical protein
LASLRSLNTNETVSLVLALTGKTGVAFTAAGVMPCATAALAGLEAPAGAAVTASMTMEPAAPAATRAAAVRRAGVKVCVTI